MSTHYEWWRFMWIRLSDSTVCHGTWFHTSHTKILMCLCRQQNSFWSIMKNVTCAGDSSKSWATKTSPFAFSTQSEWNSSLFRFIVLCLRDGQIKTIKTPRNRFWWPAEGNLRNLSEFASSVAWVNSHEKEEDVNDIDLSFYPMKKKSVKGIFGMHGMIFGHKVNCQNLN